MPSDEFSRKLERMDAAVREVERLLQGQPLESARALVTAVLDVHREALEELVSALGGATNEALVTAACRPKVAWLLGLHGTNPDPLEGRAREALRTARTVPPTEARAEIVSVQGESVIVHVSGGSEEARRLLARAVERSMAELAPEAELAFDGVLSEPREPELFAVERLVRRRELGSP